MLGGRQEASVGLQMTASISLCCKNAVTPGTSRCSVGKWAAHASVQPA